jgi:hypothetical protein
MKFVFDLVKITAAVVLASVTPHVVVYLFARMHS